MKQMQEDSKQSTSRARFKPETSEVWKTTTDQLERELEEIIRGLFHTYLAVYSWSAWRNL
jgi:hypothetical protein